MPKTRQQRLAEERAGHPPSPTQSIEDNSRVSKRTWAKTPIAIEVTPSATELTLSAPEVSGPIVAATRPACGGTKTICDEEEQFPHIRPTDRAQREGRHVEAEEPTPKPTLRWPSRSLDRMNQNKRKRFDEPVAIPSPDRGSYGLGKTGLCRNNKEYGVTEEQFGKIRRTSGLRGFTSQVAGDPNAVDQYEHQGTNVFAEYKAAQKATSTGEKSASKTPITITNSTGTLKVPSPGDSDWSDSKNEEQEGNTTGLEDVKPSCNNNGEFLLASPRFLEVEVPKIQRIPLPTQSEALQKAREKLLQFKPRNPSKLIHSSRAYQSPPSTSEATAKRGSGPKTDVEMESSVEVRHTAPVGVTYSHSFLSEDREIIIFYSYDRVFHACDRAPLL